MHAERRGTRSRPAGGTYRRPAVRRLAAGRLPFGQRVRHQPGHGFFHVIGKQPGGQRLGGQPGQRLQQVPGRRVQLLQRRLPGRGHAPRILHHPRVEPLPHPPVLAPPAGQVVGQGTSPLVHVGPGLLERSANWSSSRASVRAVSASSAAARRRPAVRSSRNETAAASSNTSSSSGSTAGAPVGQSRGDHDVAAAEPGQQRLDRLRRLRRVHVVEDQEEARMQLQPVEHRGHADCFLPDVLRGDLRHQRPHSEARFRCRSSGDGAEMNSRAE